MTGHRGYLGLETGPTCSEKVRARSVSTCPLGGSTISWERRMRLEPWGGQCLVQRASPGGRGGTSSPQRPPNSGGAAVAKGAPAPQGRAGTSVQRPRSAASFELQALLQTSARGPRAEAGTLTAGLVTCSGRCWVPGDSTPPGSAVRSKPGVLGHPTGHQHLRAGGQRTSAKTHAHAGASKLGVPEPRDRGDRHHLIAGTRTTRPAPASRQTARHATTGVCRCPFTQGRPTRDPGDLVPVQEAGQDPGTPRPWAPGGVTFRTQVAAGSRERGGRVGQARGDSWGL